VTPDDDDDDALRWGGDRDATHFESPAVPKPDKRAKPASGGADTADPGDANDLDAALPSAPGNGAFLVAVGILAGIYLLYTIGWIVTVQHTGTLATTPLEQAALVAKEYFAIAACALWFGATFLLARRVRASTRLVWLAVGAIVLIPWPFVFGIANV
jgi:hypothetical protein